MTETIPPEKLREFAGPIPRLGDPAEVAAAVCFLASDITGVTLPVDGGVTL